MKKLFVVLSLLLVVMLLVTACGPKATPAPEPTAAPAAAAEPTKAPEPAAEPTKAPEAPAAPAGGAITLWHGWTGAEADTLVEVIAAFQDANTGVTVETLAVPFDQLKNKFTTEASTGGGPDLLIGPKDWIGELSQAALIMPLDDLADKIGLNNLNQSAVDANKFQGKVWAFPESTEAVALWYNKDLVKEMPKSAEDLLKQAAEVGLAYNSGFYHSAGILLAEDGKVFDDNQACAFGQNDSVVNGLTLIKNAKGTANVIADADGGKLDAAFKDGKVGFIFNGPWGTGDYVKALGADKVGIVDPIAVGAGMFAPFLGTKNVFLSANSRGGPALDFLKFMSEPTTQAMLTKVGHIPSNPNVKVDDPIIAAFLKQTASASYFPNEPEMGAVWTPAADMITKVIEGKLEPAAAVAEACATIDAANKKEAAAPAAAAPAAAAPMPAAKGNIVLWHGWTGAEADTLAEVIAAFQAAAPDATIETLAVPFDQLKNKFTTEASTGGGPDLLIGPKDWIGELSQADLIAPLDDLASKIGLDQLNKSAVDANKFQGKVWAFPESTEAVALWYNKDLVKEMPKSAEDLLKQAAEVGLAYNSGFYHSAGILLAEDGKVFDDNQACAFGQNDSVVNGLTLIKNAKGTANVIADADGGKLDAAFKDGKVGFIFNGPWGTGDYVKALGADKVGIVDPIAVGAGMFAPFLGTKNVFLSANSTNEAAQAFLWFMAQPETQAMLTKVGHIPSNPNVKVDDPIIAAFLKQTASASYFPNEPEMGAVWTPAADMITKVIEGKAEPAAAVAEACATIDAANKK